MSYLGMLNVYVAWDPSANANRVALSAWNEGTSVAATNWAVIRTDHRVRVDILEADQFDHADTEAIALAIEEYLADDSVTVIQLDGPALTAAVPLDGLGPAMKHLGNLARSRGKRFEVRPI